MPVALGGRVPEEGEIIKGLGTSHTYSVDVSLEEKTGASCLRIKQTGYPCISLQQHTQINVNLRCAKLLILSVKEKVLYLGSIF